MRGHRRRRTTKRSPVTPFRPKGWGGTAPISSLLLLDDDHASTRRHASIWAPSRSQQMLTYFWDRTLADRIKPIRPIWWGHGTCRDRSGFIVRM